MGDATDLLRLQWIPGVSLKNIDGIPSLQNQTKSISLANCSPPLLQCFRMLETGTTEAACISHMKEAGGESALPKLFYYLERLSFYIQRTVVMKGIELATLLPTSGFFHWENVLPQTLRLSRFAYVRRRGENQVLESPRSHGVLILHDPRLSMLIHHLSVGDHHLESLVGSMPIEEPALILLLKQLHSLQALTALSASDEEDNETTLQTWEFHDFLFHTRSRRGRSPYPFGGNYRFTDIMPPAPVLKDCAEWQPTPLPEPDPLPLTKHSLATVLSNRQSHRSFGRQPLEGVQLSTFLYETARVISRFQANNGRPYAFTKRPYPSGGACYELEVYLAITHCADLEKGLYYYHPQEHKLYLIRTFDGTVQRLLEEASASYNGSDLPQVLCIVSARFARLTWKYQSMAYAAILKNVGVLYHQMYLCATALGIGACALGAGNSDLFAQASGMEYAQESSVGEFVLGSLPEQIDA